MNTQEHSARTLFPKIGMRNVKTALAAALCALVYYFLDRGPAFACIGAIFGMGGSYDESRQFGGNRFFGTMVGACWVWVCSRSTWSCFLMAATAGF